MEKGYVLSPEFLNLFGIIKNSRNISKENILELTNFVQKVSNLIVSLDQEKMTIVNKHVMQEKINNVNVPKMIIKKNKTPRFDFGKNIQKFNEEYKPFSKSKIDVFPKIKLDKLLDLNLTLENYILISPFIEK